jgi:hypothetical protein
MERFQFPAWTTTIRPLVGAGVVGGLVYVIGIVNFGFSPATTDVGYAPKQPIPYSHALHVGQLGLDCRYCHTTVEKAGFAAVPATQTCMNCHLKVKDKSPLLKPLRESWTTRDMAEQKPLQWTKVHRLPDYVYFNHSAHVTRGVSCVSCHGRVDKMEVVYQHEQLSMKWCLDCHRNPEPHLRPLDEVTNLAWVPDGVTAADDEATLLAKKTDLGKKLRAERHINPSQDCSSCHR